MARYIDADKFEKEIKMEASESIADAVVRILDRQAIADVVEVRHGKWINGRRNDWKNNTYEEMCSVCGRYTQEFRRGYCPNCGAKMDEKV